MERAETIRFLIVVTIITVNYHEGIGLTSAMLIAMATAADLLAVPRETEVERCQTQGHYVLYRPLLARNIPPWECLSSSV